jgi:hypothetical protein
MRLLCFSFPAFFAEHVRLGAQTPGDAWNRGDSSLTRGCGDPFDQKPRVSRLLRSPEVGLHKIRRGVQAKVEGARNLRNSPGGIPRDLDSGSLLLPIGWCVAIRGTSPLGGGSRHLMTGLAPIRVVPLDRGSHRPSAGSTPSAVAAKNPLVHPPTAAVVRDRGGI